MPRPPALLLALLLAGGCRGVPIEPAPTVGAIDAVAARLLQGVDPPEPDDAWRLGDRILLSIRLEEPGRPVRLWFVRASVAGLPPEGGLVWEGGRLEFRGADGKLHVERSRPLDVDLEVFDGTGTLLGVDRVAVPEAFLRAGLHEPMRALAALVPAIAAEDGPDGAGDGDLRADSEEWVRFIHGQLAVLRVVARGQAMDAVRGEVVRVVVDRPSMLSLLFSRPKRMLWACAFDRLDVARWRGRDTAGVPIRVQLDDHPLLVYRVTVAPPRPPLQLAGGLVRLDARHPDDPRRRFAVELRAARRGPAPVSPPTPARPAAPAPDAAARQR